MYVCPGKRFAAGGGPGDGILWKLSENSWKFPGKCREVSWKLATFSKTKNDNHSSRPRILEPSVYVVILFFFNMLTIRRLRSFGPLLGCSSPFWNASRRLGKCKLTMCVRIRRTLCPGRVRS